MRFAASSDCPPTIVSRLSPLPIRWELPALFLVLMAGVWIDASALFNHSFAVGYDGYYYILQINELQNHGRFYFPIHTPLILYLLTVVSHLVGNPVLAVKICSVALHAALCLGIFAIIVSVTRSWPLGIIGAVLSVTSGLHLYMVAEYINQLGALAFLIWGTWCAIRTFQTHNKVWIVPSLACLLAAIFSHRSALAIMLVVALMLALLLVLMAAKISARKYRYTLILVILALWIAPLILALQPLVDLPVGLKRELTTTPRLPLIKAAMSEQIILLLICPATLAIIFLRRERLRGSITACVFGAVALWGLLITVNPFLSTKLGMSVTWRLSILAYIQVAILVPGLIWLMRFRQSGTFFIAAFVLPLMLWSALYVRPNGTQPEYLLRRAQLLERLPLFRQQLGPRPIVISQHGEQFVVTWALGVPSQQKWPKSNEYEPIYWLLHDVDSQLLTPSMIVITTEREGRHTVLVKDEDMKELAVSNARWKLVVVRNRHLLEHLIY